MICSQIYAQWCDRNDSILHFLAALALVCVETQARKQTRLAGCREIDLPALFPEFLAHLGHAGFDSLLVRSG
jgi:hypothetical protein